jgi:hypothetical protein
MSFRLNEAWLKRTFKGVIDFNPAGEDKEAEEYPLLTR